MENKSYISILNYYCVLYVDAKNKIIFYFNQKWLMAKPKTNLKIL